MKAIITISANATTQDQNVIGPNELTRELVSEECIQTLISNMLRGGNPLTVGVGIVIEVIRKNNSDYDMENQTGPVPKSSDPIYLGTLLRQFAKNVPNFMDLVRSAGQSVTNSDGTATIKKRELKAAFGERIEPLGFDRFKTCELMAELLHCSNMALLNERGAEAEVKRRDAERDRLKAEGKLLPAKESLSGDFGTSVDSSGFHHARAPSFSSESPEEIKKLEVANNGEEEEFEKVAVSEAEPDDAAIENEKDEPLGSPLERSPKVSSPRYVDLEKSEAADLVDEPLSPNRPAPTPPDSKGSQESSEANPAESPTSAGLTDQVGDLALDQDTTMTSESSPPTESPERQQSPPASSQQPISLLSQQLNQQSDSINVDTAADMSPQDVDKPAPLFVKKAQQPAEGSESTDKSPAKPTSELGAEATPIDDGSSAHSVLLTGQEESYGPSYEVDIDGSPVVGDLLKMMFVEHRVVPTILVSYRCP